MIHQLYVIMKRRIRPSIIISLITENEFPCKEKLKKLIFYRQSLQLAWNEIWLVAWLVKITAVCNSLENITFSKVLSLLELLALIMRHSWYYFLRCIFHCTKVIFWDMSWKDIFVVILLSASVSSNYLVFILENLSCT